MSLTIQHIITDAKQLAKRLKERESIADTLLTETLALNKKIDAMKQFQEEVEQLNEVANQKPHSQLIENIQKENRHLREIQQENRELKSTLEDYHCTLEHIMSKYREHTNERIYRSKIDLKAVQNQRYQSIIQQQADKIKEMAAVMQRAAALDDDSMLGYQEMVSKLSAENKELCRPRPECPNKGFLVPNLELSPLCSSKFKSGPPGEEAQVLTQLIADVIENSRCINLEELCLLKDKLAWCLYADLVCLDYDGSLLDACIVALMACLRSVTLPHIDYDPALDVKQTNLQERRHIAVHSMPLACTLAIFDDKILLTDPTVEEENLSSGSVTVVINGDELCSVHKPGGSILSEDQLLDCIGKSQARAKSLQELINSAVNAANKMG
ncbi:hypothetical protein HUJ04_009582 [Dendroctonus ponderosae]|nr:hypothetical protein HUJ04_009582 [Dendroctonus ponderosae]